MRSIILMSALVGCADKVEPPDSVADDSAVDDTAPALPIVLRGVPQRGAEVPADARVALVHIVYGDGPVLGETLAEAPLVDGEATLNLPEVAPHLDPLSGSDAALTGALYVALAFQDTDEDGAFAEGEPLLGLSMGALVAWLSGEGVPDGAAWPAGWSVVDTGLEGQYAANRCLLDSTEPLRWRQADGYPLFSALDAVDIPLRGVEVPLGPLRIPVTQAAEGSGVAGVPIQAFQGGPSDRVYDAPVVDDAFTFTMSEPPPDAHDVNSDPDWRYTYHLNLLVDDDGYEGGTTCLDGERVWLRYTRPVTSYRGYRFLDCYAGTVGWRLARTDADTGALTYLDEAAEAAVVLDPETCRVDG
ncbi:MAG: hypothetical protein H6739_28185 [Alphaproteobacteria bacterium]|nr:hypothetical protein [Alphaproteobacteria bacterium]